MNSGLGPQLETRLDLPADVKVSPDDSFAIL